MIIRDNFTGGNIKVIEQTGNSVYLENELRDINEGVDWFYWAFCVENAEGQTVTFHFQNNRLGYFGPAISYDLKEWKWLCDCDKNKFNFSFDGREFSYTFSENEDKVYFAHSMLYHPKRFSEFAKRVSLTEQELCVSRKGRTVPFVTFGEGKRTVILTARHHACESTGNFVLEGVIEELIKNPIVDTKVICAPFVDYDGVIDGDQGKERKPHDHNRDYILDKDGIYPETKAIKELAKRYGAHYGFDFHSPWHLGDVNDCAFIVRNSVERIDRLKAFGEILESEITPTSFKYESKNDFPYMYSWNRPSPCFGHYMLAKEENEVAFTLETAYFGTPDNIFSPEKAVELGRCFARALSRYIAEKEGKIPLKSK